MIFLNPLSYYFNLSLSAYKFEVLDLTQSSTVYTTRNIYIHDDKTTVDRIFTYYLFYCFYRWYKTGFTDLDIKIQQQVLKSQVQ
jgi:hypothetical protein